MRVNVESEIISKMPFMAAELNREPMHMLGCLVKLWHDTQNAGITEAMGSSIVTFFGVNNPDEGDRMLDVLTAHGIVFCVQAAASTNVRNCARKFVIVGNEKHIFALKSYKERAQKGGLKSASLRKGEAKTQTKTRTSKRKSVSSNSLSYSSKQQLEPKFEPNTIQLQYNYNTNTNTSPMGSAFENALPPAEPLKEPDKKAKVAKFVAAYVQAYAKRFPERRPEDLSDGKVRGQIRLFAEQHPDIDRACQLIQVYFQMDQRWFETKGWDFLTFKNNLAVVGQALDSGDGSGSQGLLERLKRMNGEV